MSGTRTFIENAERIDAELQKASQCKDCRESIRILEALQTDRDIKHFLTQSSDKQAELFAAYNSLIRTFTSELYQLSEYIAAQLDELDNIKTDESSPASHTNASYAFSNLSHYLVDDILSTPDNAMRVLALKRWIKVLDISMKSNDYHSAAAIHAGLNNAALSRLQTIFIHLTDEEESYLHQINETFIRDQGWHSMNKRLHSNDLNYFIPSLAGIKKAATKAKEARQAHSMHADYLESEGKLSRPSSLSTASSTADATKSKDKTPLDLLEELIKQLKQSAYLKHANQLTSLQRHLTQANPDQTVITIKPIYHDENMLYTDASQLERDEIPQTLIHLQQELLDALNMITSQHKLQDPWKTIKKSLSKFTPASILSHQYPNSEECINLEALLTTLCKTNQQGKASKHPTLSRTNTKTKLTGSDTDLPNIHKLKKLVSHINSLKKRHDRLIRESSTSSTSILSSTSSSTISTTSTAASLNAPGQISESSSSSQLSSDSNSALSSHSSISSKTPLSQFDFTLLPPTKTEPADTTTVTTSPLKETKSIHKRDAASEKHLLSRHGSMSMTPRKSSPGMSSTSQGSPDVKKNSK